MFVTENHKDFRICCCSMKVQEERREHQLKFHFTLISLFFPSVTEFPKASSHVMHLQMFLLRQKKVKALDAVCISFRV